MPRNASGTYSLPSGNPLSSGTLIDANWANNTLNDLANEITDSLSRSAEGSMLAPLRLTDGVQATPSLAFTNEPSTGLYRAGTNEAWFVTGGNQVAKFTSTGMDGRFAAGAVATPSLAAYNDVNTGLWFPAADTIAASTGGVERLRVDSSGNLGIGVTPSAWAAFTALQVFRGSIASNAAETDLNHNAFYDGAWKYIGTGEATNFFSASGAYIWRNAASGTAGAAITFAERMRLDSSGNLGIGTASPAYKLDVAGAVQATDYRVAAASTLFLTGDTLTVRTTGGSSRFAVDSNTNVIAGTQVALATTATDGFLYVPTCAGTPTGTPTAITGMAPIVVNTTNNKLYFYSGGAWRDAGP